MLSLCACLLCSMCCSLSLYLGNEIFDVHVMQLQGDYNHLFVRQGTGLQGQAVFKTKLTFRFVPFSCFNLAQCLHIDSALSNKC